MNPTHKVIPKNRDIIASTVKKTASPKAGNTSSETIQACKETSDENNNLIKGSDLKHALEDSIKSTDTSSSKRSSKRKADESLSSPRPKSPKTDSEIPQPLPANKAKPNSHLTGEPGQIRPSSNPADALIGPQTHIPFRYTRMDSKESEEEQTDGEEVLIEINEPKIEPRTPSRLSTCSPCILSFAIPLASLYKFLATGQVVAQQVIDKDRDYNDPHNFYKRVSYERIGLFCSIISVNMSAWYISRKSALEIQTVKPEKVIKLSPFGKKIKMTMFGLGLTSALTFQAMSHYAAYHEHGLINLFLYPVSGYSYFKTPVKAFYHVSLSLTTIPYLSFTLGQWITDKKIFLLQQQKKKCTFAIGSIFLIGGRTLLYYHNNAVFKGDSHSSFILDTLNISSLIAQQLMAMSTQMISLSELSEQINNNSKVQNTSCAKPLVLSLAWAAMEVVNYKIVDDWLGSVPAVLCAIFDLGNYALSIPQLRDQALSWATSFFSCCGKRSKQEKPDAKTPLLSALDVTDLETNTLLPPVSPSSMDA